MTSDDTLKLAVMEERTKHQAQSMDEMKSDLKTLAQDVKKIVNVLEKVETIERDSKLHGETIVKHITIGKVLIFIITLCGGLIGWAYNSLDQLKLNDNELRERVVKLEMLYNATNTKH